MVALFCHSFCTFQRLAALPAIQYGHAERKSLSQAFVRPFRMVTASLGYILLADYFLLSNKQRTLLAVSRIVTQSIYITRSGFLQGLYDMLLCGREGIEPSSPVIAIRGVFPVKLSSSCIPHSTCRHRSTTCFGCCCPSSRR